MYFCFRFFHWLIINKIRSHNTFSNRYIQKNVFCMCLKRVFTIVLIFILRVHRSTRDGPSNILQKLILKIYGHWPPHSPSLGISAHFVSPLSSRYQSTLLILSTTILCRLFANFISPRDFLKRPAFWSSNSPCVLLMLLAFTCSLM